MRKILLFIGSARRGGNTELLAESFQRGAEAAGHEVTALHAAQLDIGPCLDCRACCVDGHACIQRDGMVAVYAAFDRCDTIVFASPVYFDGFSAQMKLMLDRLYCVGAHHDFRYPERDCALLMVAESHRAACFDLPLAHYNRVFCEYMGWHSLGTVLVRGVDKVGDIIGTPGLDEARLLGESI